MHDNLMNETQKQDDFIMFPTNDVCFAGLMENPVVRKGFCAAIMRVRPEEIEETELLPTHLKLKYAGDKLGILDVRVRLKDGLQINMEMQVNYFEFWDERALFYLSKMFSGQLKQGDSYEKLQRCIHVSILDFIRFPEDKECYRRILFRDDVDGGIYNNKMELQFLELKKLKDISKFSEGTPSEEDIIGWMRFFNGKNREEFKRMAQTNEYLGEAYEALERLSADEKRRLEYEARDKALMDHNTLMNNMRRLREEIEEMEKKKRDLEIGEKRGMEIGEKRGMEIGEENGIQLACKVLRLYAQGMSEKEIASKCDVPVEKVQKIVVL